MRPRAAALLVLAVAAPAYAQDVDAFRARERDALVEAAGRCARLGSLASDAGDDRTAAEEARHATTLLALLPPGPRSPWAAAPLGPIDDRTRDIEHGLAVAAVAAAARAWNRAGGREAHDRLLAAATAAYGIDRVAAPFGLEFDPLYLTWLPADDRRLLASGWERVGGEWIDPEEVARRDAAHAAPDAPWEISDGVHAVRSSLPLRTTLAALAQARAVRGLAAALAGDPAVLRRGDRPLPLVLVPTRERMRELLGPALDGHPLAALYVRADPGPGPVVASPEVGLADGRVVRAGAAGLAWVLRHEIVHQVLYEAFRDGAPAPFPSDEHAWLAEGLAAYLAEWEPGPHGGRLRAVRTRQLADGVSVPGPFAACAETVDRLPAPAEIVAWGRDAFRDAASYRVAATFVHFLVDGGDARRRERVVSLARAVHGGRGPARTFDAVFPGEDPARMAGEFRAWVRTLTFEEE